MRKTILSIVIVFVAAINGLMAQNYPFKKKPSFEYTLAFKDFKTPASIKASSVSQMLIDKSYAEFSDLSAALGFKYLQGLTDNIDFTAGADVSFLNYPFSNATKKLNANKFLISADAGVNIKLLNDNHFLSPYLTAGLGASMYNATYFSAFNYLGSGLQFRLTQDVYLLTQLSYRIKVTDLATNHIQYSLGVAVPVSDKKPAVKTVPPPAPIEEKDSDGDGVADSKDKCPKVAGLVKYNGCPIPDTDGDGIDDEKDKCVSVKGVAKYNGCPIPDTDKDGVNDEEDKCPNVPGFGRYNGCPIPDTDKDGVNDEEDKCPDVAGTKANYGCPEIQKTISTLAKQVYFSSSSIIISKKSVSSLDSVVAILKKHTNVRLTVEGHTDNVGGPITNKKLSQQRANAIKTYLVGKGINAGRIEAIGYGLEKPLADNNTEAGRALNRRVELKATFEE